MMMFFRSIKRMCVSVPYRGATFLNQNGICLIEIDDILFPSPIGELHFSIIAEIKHGEQLTTVSVPYRGATFLNTYTKILEETTLKGFRPLSGSYISQ